MGYFCVRKWCRYLCTREHLTSLLLFTSKLTGPNITLLDLASTYEIVTDETKESQWITPSILMFWVLQYCPTGKSNSYRTRPRSHRRDVLYSGRRWWSKTFDKNSKIRTKDNFARWLPFALREELPFTTWHRIYISLHVNNLWYQEKISYGLFFIRRFWY